jgi:hypothetical protein
MTIECRWTRRAVGRSLLVGLLFLASPGCGEDELPPSTVRKPLPLTELPEVVMKAAKKELPGVTFRDAWQNLEKGTTLHSYEIRGQRSDGKISEVRISPDGKILEREG